MLVRMGIKNFALIEHMQLEFAKGITIFTGETGSGKSIDGCVFHSIRRKS